MPLPKSAPSKLCINASSKTQSSENSALMSFQSSVPGKSLHQYPFQNSAPRKPCTNVPSKAQSSESSAPMFLTKFKKTLHQCFQFHQKALLSLPNLNPQSLHP
ncbi:hypothetical protein CEXT_664571 [Caerostris extrusa]|uniref:Uncharacterized protein n=1 Tax=Caerostris extrusa TaxID=172846 RepID=A0AAV4WQM5_CAEEX|nr:hypothetical protein CEXT_664571 [Caerostris extrusa]